MTSDPVAFYHANGYVVKRGIFGRGSTRSWRTLAERAVRTEWARVEPHAYHEVIFSIHQLAKRYPEFAPLVMSAKLNALAAELLGGQARVLLDQVICKARGARATIPHQDAPFLPLGDQVTTNCWIALDDVDETNGALVYFAGSNMAPALPLVHLDQSPAQLDPTKLGYGATTIRMSAGDCVFHDGRTIHAAHPNASEASRLAISIQYMLEGAIAHEPLHPFMRDAGITPGEPLTHACFLRPTPSIRRQAH